MQFDEFNQWLCSLGANDAHRTRLWRAWLSGRELTAGGRRQQAARFFPRAVLQALPQLSERLHALARVVSEHAAEDAAQRWLLELHDGQQIETVLLPRDAVCVSSQVGCAVACRFCMTGRSGLLRQLSVMEILAQVVLARWHQALRKVVFMGMGEPAHNLDAVLQAIELLGSYAGLAHKQLVLSTVGDERVFERLPQQVVKPALALSLHTTRPELRRQLLPHAPLIAPEQLIEHCRVYGELGKYPIQYQWTLLAGVNDGDDEFVELARLLRGHYAVVNLIPYNRMEGDLYARPTPQRIETIARYLHGQGILTKVRDSAGQRVDGGCGQLRARASAVRVQRKALVQGPA